MLEGVSVHPSAAAFRMLSDADLADLAEDIKANGLLHAIVRGPDGSIWDGRNRYAACKLAGVEPTFIDAPVGADPVAHVLSQNARRRHITQGQLALSTVRAVGLCKLHETRGMQGRIVDESGVRQDRLSQAMVIEEHAPELAEAVLDGAKPFSKAYEEARVIRDEKERREKGAAADAARLERIRAADDGLHLLVTEGRLSLDEAVAVLDKREKDERDRKLRDTRYFVDASMTLRSLLWRDPDTIVEEWVDGASEHQQRGPFAEEIWTPDGLRSLASALEGLAVALEARKEG